MRGNRWKEAADGLVGLPVKEPGCGRIGVVDLEKMIHRAIAFANAGEHGLQTLVGTPQAAVRSLEIIHVCDTAEPLADSTIFIAHGERAPEKPPIGAVARQQPRLAEKDVALALRVGEAAEKLLSIVG